MQSYLNRTVQKITYSLVVIVCRTKTKTFNDFNKHNNSDLVGLISEFRA